VSDERNKNAPPSDAFRVWNDRELSWGHPQRIWFFPTARHVGRLRHRGVSILCGQTSRVRCRSCRRDRLGSFHRWRWLCHVSGLHTCRSSRFDTRTPQMAAKCGDADAVASLVEDLYNGAEWHALVVQLLNSGCKRADGVGIRHPAFRLERLLKTLCCLLNAQICSGGVRFLYA